MKKLLCLTLALIMVATVFSGCGKDQNSVIDIATTDELDPEKIGYYSSLKLPIDTGGTTIRCFLKGTGEDINNTVVINELRRRTGLNVQIELTPQSAYVEKANVIMASKSNLPDIIGEIDINSFGVQGAFEPIDEHLDELPNLKEIFYDKTEEYETVDFMKALIAEDGHTYMWPVWDIQRDVNHGFLYRKDIFDKHGIEMWNSTEEFYQVLKKLKELYPDSYPLTSKTGTQIFVDFGGMWNIRSFEIWTPYYDEEAKVWKQSLTDPKMKEILDFLKKLYNEGLIDPEFLTMTETMWTSKMTQADKGFISFDMIGRMDLWKSMTADTIPDYDVRFGNPIGGGKLRTLDKIWGNLGVVKSERSLKALKLLDYTISESGAELLTMGIKGENFDIDENGKVNYIGKLTANNATQAEIEEKLGVYTALCNRYDKRCTYYKFTEKEQEAQDLINNMEGGGFHPFDPIVLFTGEEETERADLQPVVRKAAEEFFTKYILTPEYGDKEWDKWLQQANKIGSKRLVELYNQAQKRYDAQ